MILGLPGRTMKPSLAILWVHGGFFNLGLRGRVGDEAAKAWLRSPRAGRGCWHVVSVGTAGLGLCVEGARRGSRKEFLFFDHFLVF